jgi:hypothetical protein
MEKIRKRNLTNVRLKKSYQEKLYREAAVYPNEQRIPHDGIKIEKVTLRRVFINMTFSYY